MAALPVTPSWLYLAQWSSDLVTAQPGVAIEGSGEEAGIGRRSGARFCWPLPAAAHRHHLHHWSNWSWEVGRGAVEFVVGGVAVELVVGGGAGSGAAGGRSEA